ncbi:hypothetical protein thsps117_04840 [Pseudomonas sp. No.117]
MRSRVRSISAVALRAGSRGSPKLKVLTSIVHPRGHPAGGEKWLVTVLQGVSADGAGPPNDPESCPSCAVSGSAWGGVWGRSREGALLMGDMANAVHDAPALATAGPVAIGMWMSRLGK